MARFKEGWVKAWRKSVEGDLPCNIWLWGIWHWLLLAATWKPTKILWQGKQRELPPGSVVMGLGELATKWDCSKNTIKRWLIYLEETDRISLEMCTRGTLVTIRNWDIYQSRDEDECTPTAHELHTNCTRTAHELNVSKEGKKERKKERKIDRVGFASKLPPLAELWNQISDSKLPKIQRMHQRGARYRSCQARWEENPDSEYWKKIIERINQSSFCLGNNDRAWKADIEFLCRPDTPSKVLEGKYDSRANTAQIDPSFFDFLPVASGQ